jgi:hypothetical protein
VLHVLWGSAARDAGAFALPCSGCARQVRAGMLIWPGINTSSPAHLCPAPTFVSLSIVAPACQPSRAASSLPQLPAAWIPHFIAAAAAAAALPHHDHQPRLSFTASSPLCISRPISLVGLPSTTEATPPLQPTGPP